MEPTSSLTSRLAESERAILDMIQQERPLGDVLETICLTIEREGPGMLCSVLLVDDEGQHLLHGAAPSLPVEYSEAIDGVSIADGVGSCGTAAFTARPCFVENISTHPNWAAFKALAHDEHGLSACWSTPILAQDGSVLATFAVYYREPRTPGLAERKLIDFSAHLVAIAVSRYRESNAAAA